jgi:hypothetical protein
MSFDILALGMALPEQKKKLLKAKIAVALHDELGRVPKKEEIEQVFLLARVMYSGSHTDYIQNPTCLKKPLASLGERVCKA